MNGNTAASNALGHSSCGRWPQPDIATSLCKAYNQLLEGDNQPNYLQKKKKTAIIHDKDYEEIGKLHVQNITV